MEANTDTMVPNAAKVTREKVADDIRVLVRDAEDLLKATGNGLGERAIEARTRLMSTLAKAKVTCHELEEKAAAGAKAADRVIRQHPYESIGLAFGVGLLMGVLLNRK